MRQMKTFVTQLILVHIRHALQEQKDAYKTVGEEMSSKLTLKIEIVIVWIVWNWW